jgi:LuxR family transcriptional regulator, maltose regulon positive regulatory protein
MAQLQAVLERSSSAPSGRGRHPAHALELLEAKLALPPLQPGTVVRTGLVNRLRASRCPLITVVGPAGYGKTTLLSHWAERDRRSFAWLSPDEGDDDPGVLLRYVAAALHREGAVPDTMATLPRLALALSHASAPIVLVLDDLQFVRSRESGDLIATLERHMPEGSTLALAGRTLPDLPIARSRVAGRLLELGATDLAFGRREAQLLLRAAQLELDEADLMELMSRTEGWAAGLHLAGLFLQGGPGQRRSVADFAGDDRFVADYFRFEHLSRLGRAELRFLTRSSVLDSMCGPLCDAVLGKERQGSATRLESLEQSSLFVVPLDRRRVWFRYHHLFREALRAELERREPDLVPELNRRAAAWCEANGAPEAARRYAAATGDVHAVARVVAAHALPAYCEGRGAELDSWLDGFDDPVRLEEFPVVAALGSWVHALSGRTDQADLWLEAAEQRSYEGVLPDATHSLAPWIALLRAAFCRDGVDQMLVDAESACEGLARRSQWRPTALLLRGVAHLLLGDDERAEALFAEADKAAAIVGATETRRLALAERSLLAIAGGDYARGRGLADAARSLGADSSGCRAVPDALQLAVSARAELRHGTWEQARLGVEEAERLAPALNDAFPWFGVQTLLELARVEMALLDAAAAHTHLARAESILERRPLGVLAMQAKGVRSELRALVDAQDHTESVLTAAELRLLPFLPTHLTFREIGARLHVSRNTVKTQAISIYRKLGASSRADAIDRAGQLGLVE